MLIGASKVTGDVRLHFKEATYDRKVVQVHVDDLFDDYDWLSINPRAG